MLVPLFISLVVSLAVLYLSGEKVVHHGRRLAARLGVSSFFFGLLVVAVGTSLPEIVVGLVSALEGEPHVVVGDILGSNVADVLLLLGVYSLLGPWILKEDEVSSVVASLSFAGIAFVYALLRGELSVLDAVVLIGLFFLFIRSRLPESEMDRASESASVEDLIVFLLALVGLVVSAHTSVKSVVLLAEVLSLPVFVVSVLTLALGTSLPELSVGLNAIRRGEPHIAMGDAIGSVVVNTTLGLGLPAFLTELPVFLWEERFTILLLLLSLFLFTYYVNYYRRLDRRLGFLLLSLYVIFVVGVLL